MSAFLPAPTKSELRATKLISATRSLRTRLRELGLSGGGTGELKTADMESRAKALARTLGLGEHGTLTAAQRGQLYYLVPWMHSQSVWRFCLEQLFEQVEMGRVSVPPRAWVSILEYASERSGVWSAFQRAALQWRPPVLRRHSLLQRAMGCPRAADLADSLANQVVVDRVALPSALAAMALHRGSPLAGQVMVRLTSASSREWLWAHPKGALEVFVSQYKGTTLVGRVAESLLGHLVDAGAQPGDVGVGRPLSEVVAMLVRGLPSNTASNAWKPVGPGAQELIRWWRTQRDLEQFFSQWNAEDEREAYWRRFVKHITAIEGFEKGGAIAIRLGDVWYVEVGVTGFATYAFSQTVWHLVAPRFRKADKPSVFRSRSHRLDRLTHRPGWQPKFDQWIGELSGVKL